MIIQSQTRSNRESRTDRASKGVHTFHALCICLAALALSLASVSCERSYVLDLEPPEALRALEEAREIDPSVFLVDGLPTAPGLLSSKEKSLTLEIELEGWKPVYSVVKSTSLFGETQLTISLERLVYPLSIELANGASQILINGEAREGLDEGGGTALLEYGRHTITLQREDLDDQIIEIDLKGPRSLRLKHQKHAGPARSIGFFPSGSQPKQVVFTPDSRFLIVPLLNDVGFELIDLARDGAARRITAPDSDKKGYVEPLILADKERFWISQMTTGMIHEYTLPDENGDISFIRTLSAYGSWSKVIASDKQRRFLAVSNWLTNDVAIIDYQSGALVRKLSNLAIPRGLAFSPDGAFLYIASYNGDSLYQYSTENWKETKRFRRTRAAMRHIVLSPDGSKLFVNDMRNALVYRLDAKSLALEKTYRLGDYNPNTIDLSPDGKRLFVSCRGPNNPKSYLLRSPADGHIYIIDVESGEVLQRLVGGNQPTGLDVSNDGKFLAFTNFLDDIVEVYTLVD